MHQRKLHLLALYENDPGNLIKWHTVTVGKKQQQPSVWGCGVCLREAPYFLPHPISPPWV